MITKKIGNFKEHNVYLTLKIIELLITLKYNIYKIKKLNKKKIFNS